MMRRTLFLIIGFGMIIACGCQPSEIDSVDSDGFGHFKGDVVATWNVDGRKMTLVNDFEYIDSNDRRWVAPTGSIVDGASIPGAFWTFIGGPFEGKYRYASVVHDIECERMTSSWEEVHRMFYEAMRCAGVNDSQAKTMYYAVYHFGPRWEPVESLDQLAVQDEQIPTLPHECVARSRTGRRMKCYQPPPPTQEELERLRDFIQEENPDPAAIERTCRETLCRRPHHQHNTGSSPQRQSDSPSDVNDKLVGSSAWSGRSNRNSDHDGSFGQARQRSAAIKESVVSEVDQYERQWIIGKVAEHLTSNSKQPIPATYDIDQSSTEYRVKMQVHSQTRQGQSTGYHDEQLIVRVSKAGEVLEVLR